MIILSLPCVSQEPAFNAYYFVKGSDDSWYVGEVIQKREVELDNEKKKEFSSTLETVRNF